RLLRFAAAAFLLAYLSWEASGFIIVALLAGTCVVRADWKWTYNENLWRCFTIVIFVVVLQLCFRQLTLAPDYLGFIRDLSQLTTPAFVPLDRLVFDPFYYIKIFFLGENQVILTALAIAGIWIGFRNKALVYLDVSLLAMYFSYTFFLDHYAPRYCIVWLPLLVLSGSSSFFMLWDRVSELRYGPLDLAAGVICALVSLVMLLGATNQYALKLFRIAPDPANPAYFDRMGVQFKANYGDADRYVVSHLQEGDAVLTRAPHVYYFVTGRKPDYCFDPRLLMRVFYDGGLSPPGYIDKWLGVRQLRSLAELKDVQARSRRVWIIADMTHSAGETYNFTEDVNAYLLNNGVFAYESEAQKVVLLNGAGRIDTATR
ncbi:MAG TPA: hypothetical protein VMT64_02080, partial [Candidatus Binataceae bacterium]|nr:hypothetical protein [Candidatus Binataceae bacterium]